MSSTTLFPSSHSFNLCINSSRLHSKPIQLPVCPYTFISIILSSFMIECRDLALNHRWVMGLQRHGAHISVITLTLLPTSVCEIIIYQQKFVINRQKNSINVKKDSSPPPSRLAKVRGFKKTKFTPISIYNLTQF